MYSFIKNWIVTDGYIHLFISDKRHIKPSMDTASKSETMKKIKH